MSDQTLKLPQEGEKVGSGIIMDLISAGGSARVYRTWLAALELYRAVKVINPDANDEARARFGTEAKISSKLIHQNIVQIHNFGETVAGLPYIEMELVIGQTLESVLHKHGALPLPVVLAMMIGVLEAVHYAHNIRYTLNMSEHCGIMHRDIKPGNVIFSGGIPKLMDFGIARPVNVSLHTQQNSVPGTAPYVAPESWASGDTDFRSDIYQIGLLMYECISGKIAYPQGDMETITAAIMAGTRKPLDTHPKAAAIVNKCLELDPKKRYQTAQECLADVRALFHAQSPRITPDAQITAFLTGTAPVVVKATHTGNIGKYLKIAAVAIPGFLLVLLIVVFGFTYLTNLLQSITLTRETTSAAPATTEPPPPPAAPTAAPPPPPKSATQPRRNVGAGSARPTQAQPPKQAAAAVGNNDTPPPAASPEDAQRILDEAKKLLAQRKAQEALPLFQQALKTPSETLPRQEIIKQSIYGSAQCNTILFNDSKISRANYEASWRSVLNTFPVGSPEHNEATNKRLNLDNNGAEK